MANVYRNYPSMDEKGEDIESQEAIPTFTWEQKRNIGIYTVGIMLYKFGIEAFVGSIIALATNRWDREAKLAGVEPTTFTKTGIMTALYQVSQCIGSLFVPPLLKPFHTKTVMSYAVFVFGVLTAMLLVVDAATGGRVKPRGWDSHHERDDFGYYGTYNTNFMIPIYCIVGLAYGAVETIRRVIPKDIVGSDVTKLLRMDSFVHICYELAGTTGALLTSLVFIPNLGNNMSFVITPFFLAAAGVTWRYITPPPLSEAQRLRQAEKAPMGCKGLITSVGKTLVDVPTSYVRGVKIVFGSRKYLWLPAGYSLAIYCHRFAENNIVPMIARRYLGNAAWSQIMVAGSCVGELFGALTVFFFSTWVGTPLPWVRLDALMLNIFWFLGSWYPPQHQLAQAFVVFGLFVPISFGYAAGDVSLVAYIQGQLQASEHKDDLPAVMSFLYTAYVVVYAVCSPMLGRYVDSVYRREHDAHPAIKNIAGVQYSVLSVVIFLATFIPVGAWAFNPKRLNGDAKDSGEASENTTANPSLIYKEDKEAETSETSENRVKS